MHAPQAAGEHAHAAPGVQQMPLQVPLDHLVGGAVEGPNGVAGSDVQQMQAGWIGVDLPFVQILAVFVEHLNAMVVAIVHEHVVRLRIDGDAVHVAEVAGARLDRDRAAGPPLLAPLHQELAVLVELRDARAGVAVGDEEGAVGQPVDDTSAG